MAIEPPVDPVDKWLSERDYGLVDRRIIQKIKQQIAVVLKAVRDECGWELQTLSIAWQPHRDLSLADCLDDDFIEVLPIRFTPDDLERICHVCANELIHDDDDPDSELACGHADLLERFATIAMAWAQRFRSLKPAADESDTEPA